MAHIYYYHKFKKNTYDPLGPSFNILNWRVLKNDKYNVGRDAIEGVTFVADHTIFIPHIVIEDIHNFNRENEKVEQFYTGRDAVAPNICLKCWGKGKLDWLENATGVQGPKLHNTFIRDQTSILIYEGFENIIFGRTVLGVGENYCGLCKGTGVQLSARFPIFGGMLGIKKKLKPVVTKIKI